NGVVGSTVGLSKVGSGTWIVSGTNSYSGGTTVTAGKLIVTNPNALSTGTLYLNGGTLYVTSSMTLTNNFVLAADSVIGTTSGSVSLTFDALSGGNQANRVSNLTLTLANVDRLTFRDNTTIAQNTLLQSAFGGGIIDFAGGLTITATQGINVG